MGNWGSNDLFKVIFLRFIMVNHHYQIPPFGTSKSKLWLTKVATPITPTLEVKPSIKVE